MSALDTVATTLIVPGAVASVMHRDVTCVRAQDSVESAVALIHAQGGSGLPVVDEAHRPIGFLRERDAIRAEAEGLIAGDALDSLDELRPLRASLVCDVMNRDVMTVREQDSVMLAAEMLAEHGLLRAPVVNAVGRLVGVVTALDLLRALVVPRGEMED